MLRMRHSTSGERDYDSSEERRPMTRMLHETSGRPNYLDMPRMLHETSGRPNYLGTPRMLHASSGRPQFSDPSIVGVNCDGCRVSIDSIRYKCACCPNFDFCPSCMDEYERELLVSRGNERLHIAHPFNHHIFQRITFRVNTKSAPAFQNRVSWIHAGVKCSNCPSTSGDIVGYRYFCTNCAVSLCESCELAGAHRLDHNLLKMVPQHIANNPDWQQGNGPSSTRK